MHKNNKDTRIRDFVKKNKYRIMLIQTLCVLVMVMIALIFQRTESLIVVFLYPLFVLMFLLELKFDDWPRRPFPFSHTFFCSLLIFIGFIGGLFL